MTLEAPFRWTDPASWPWFFYPALAAMIGIWAKQFHEWQKRRKSSAWPTATGRIEAAEVPAQKKILGLTLSPAKRRPCPAELRYSYLLQGQNYSGTSRRDLPDLDAANDFVRDLQGLPVTVRYDPEKPSTSVLLDDAVEALLEARPPGPPVKDPVPGWLKPLLWPCIVLSLVGLVLSMWVHFGALFGRQVAPSEYFWILHMGIFVVFFPAVLVSQKQAKKWRINRSWRDMFPGAPRWVNTMVGVFFVYALINFAIFMFYAPTGTQHGPETPPEVWRGFSGHWMLFYSAAFGMLYSAARTGRGGTLCMNGHAIPPGAVLCPVCGQPAKPYR